LFSAKYSTLDPSTNEYGNGFWKERTEYLFSEFFDAGSIVDCANDASSIIISLIPTLSSYSDGNEFDATYAKVLLSV
jgi:hypothetical protein